MAKLQLETFKDIIDAVREELGIQSTDTTLISRIKRDINIVYIDEIVPYHNWWWTRNQTTVQLEPYISAGTVVVTSGSVDLTFTEAPAVSMEGAKFSTTNYNEIYIIDEHTGGSTTAKLNRRYTGTSQTAASYRLWWDYVNLPSNVKNTIDAWHAFDNTKMLGLGKQDFNKTVVQAPKAEGRPKYYSTGDFVQVQPYSEVAVSSLTRSSEGLLKTIVFDASVSGSLSVGDSIKVEGAAQYSFNGEFQVVSITTTNTANDTVNFVGKARLSQTSTSDTGITLLSKSSEQAVKRYRQMFVYPSLFDGRVSITVDYNSMVEPLDNDADEPEIPLEDRSVLLYGALHRAWARERNPEESQRNLQLFLARLARMAADTQDSVEKPTLRPSRQYLRQKRSSAGGLGLDIQRTGFGSGGTSQVITGTPNQVAVFDADGTLKASSDVSSSELSFLDGLTTNVVGVDSTQTLTNKTINADDNTLTNIDNDEIKASAGIELSKLELLGNGNRVLESDGSGEISESDITNTELDYLNEVEALTTATLSDNTTGNVTTWTVASFDSVDVVYSIERNSTNYESGRISIISDGTNVAISNGSVAQIGTPGVTFSADIDSGNLRLRYTTTSTGNDATMKYKVQKWQA